MCSKFFVIYCYFFQKWSILHLFHQLECDVCVILHSVGDHEAPVNSGLYGNLVLQTGQQILQCN